MNARLLGESIIRTLRAFECNAVSAQRFYDSNSAGLFVTGVVRHDAWIVQKPLYPRLHFLPIEPGAKLKRSHGHGSPQEFGMLTAHPTDVRVVIVDVQPRSHGRRKSGRSDVDNLRFLVVGHPDIHPRGRLELPGDERYSRLVNNQRVSRGSGHFSILAEDDRNRGLVVAGDWPLPIVDGIRRQQCSRAVRHSLTECSGP